MKSRSRHINKIILFCLISAISISNSNAESEEADAEENGGDLAPPEETCKKSVFNLIQGFLNAALTCLGGKLRLGSPFELVTRLYCIIKCTLMELGVISATGELDEVGAVFYFQEAIPLIIRDTVVEDAQPCLALASEFQPKQYYCQSYSRFIQCVITSLLRTFTPYALECFTTPGLGFFFSFIDVIVPRASSATSPEANEVRRRYTQQILRYRKRHPNNNTTTTTGNNTTLQLARSFNSRLKSNSTKSPSPNLNLKSVGL